ncbi:hypothetical protein [Micromonospora zhanjiangensis]|uniref:Uncharacterized protein n=1 Tax=Micromonospora zhanjiangensis TaxID=1522057 RepID=A0ABV8KTR7_9ACTN
MHSFLVNVLWALAIWLVLVVAGVVTLVVLARRGLPDRPRREPREAIRRTGRKVRRPRRPSRLARFARRLGGPARRRAHEAAVVAGLAAVTARSARQEWLAARQRVAQTRRALHTVDAGPAARVLPTTGTVGRPDDDGDRARYLHRIVMAAYWRAEISSATMLDALAHRNGWDPELEPAEQDRALSRAIRADRVRAHQAAVESEQAAWRAAMVAAADARLLRDEALALATPWARRRIVRGTAIAPVVAPDPDADAPAAPDSDPAPAHLRPGTTTVAISPAPTVATLPAPVAAHPATTRRPAGATRPRFVALLARRRRTVPMGATVR